jgi:hypothetical protein
MQLFEPGVLLFAFVVIETTIHAFIIVRCFPHDINVPQAVWFGSFAAACSAATMWSTFRS